MRAVGAILAIAGVPVAALLLLALTGRASVGAVILACTASLLAALLWSRDLDTLAETMREVGAGEPTGRAVRAPWLPGMQVLGRAVERLARRVSERAAQMER